LIHNIVVVGVPQDTASPSGVRGGNDGCQIGGANTAVENTLGHHAPNGSGCDVVEKNRHHENEREEHYAASPIGRKAGIK
jgi:hypothetical protein